MGMRQTRRIPPGTVRRDLRRQTEGEKDRQREDFGRWYGELEVIRFLGEGELNMDKFVVIPKDLLDYDLSKAALAVYRVLCSRADFEVDHPFRVSQANIGVLAGVSEDTVRKALDELVEAGLLTRELKQDGRRRFYTYKVFFIRKPMLREKEHKGNQVYFHTCIIDSGIWAGLRPRAKALYLVMQITAEQDQDLYSSVESSETGECYEEMERHEYLRSRRWDVCSLSMAELCRLADIDRRGIQSVLEELEHHRLRLIERVGRWTKVYLRPRTGLLP